MAKNFKDNPALDFISGSNPIEEAVPLPVNAVVNETKSKRVQLLVYPKVYEAVKQKAAGRGISFNELANELLKRYIEE